MVWFGYEIVWSIAGVPRLVGPIVAFAVAALITVDPAGLFWPRSPKRHVTTSPVERALPAR